MKKTLKDLTPEIQSRIQEYKNKCLNGITNDVDFPLENSVKYIHKIYELAGQKKPIVFEAKNINEYKILFELIPKLLSTKNTNLNTNLSDSLSASLYDSLDASLRASLNDSLDDSLSDSLDDSLRASLNDSLDASLSDSLSDSLNASLYDSLDASLRASLRDSLRANLDENKTRSSWAWFCSIYSRVFFTWYKFIQDEFNIKHDKKDVLNELYELVLKTNISRCWFTEKYVLYLKTPKDVKFNNNNVLHNVSGASMKWDSEEHYHVNGRVVEKKLITEPITKEMIINETNEDLRAAMVTIIKERYGNSKLLEVLNAEIIDEQTLVHECGSVETIKLFKTKEKYSFLQDRHGKFNQPYAWTQMNCPSTGQAYLIDTSADFTNALDSIKYHRPNGVPFELAYSHSMFAN